MSTSTFDPAYWDERYRQHETKWDIGDISIPLKVYFDQLPDKAISILIPGCGNSYEAAYLLEQGFTNITLIDISPLLTEELSKKFADQSGKQLTIITGDFFELQAQYDLIIEQTFFCALQPSQRGDYVKKMHELLKPGGKLVGVLFDRAFEGGPPFGGSKAEYEPLFGSTFSLRTMEPCYNSIKPRAGTELFFIAEKKK